MTDNDIPIARIFGERVRARRKDLKLTQGQVYEMTGISPAYISSVERGTANPSLDIMVQLSVALECSLVNLLA